MVECLSLLSHAVSDPRVRKFATEHLSVLTTQDLFDYCAPLVYSTEYDIHSFPPISFFLLNRATENLHFKTHLYWILKSNLQQPKLQILLESLLLSSNSDFRQTLIYHETFLTILTSIALEIQLAASNLKQKRFQKAIESIEDFFKNKINFFGYPANDFETQQKNGAGPYQPNQRIYSTPLEPTLQLDGIVKEKCKLYESKTVLLPSQNQRFVS